MKRDKNGQIDFGHGELLFQFLIVLNLVAFATETLPDLSESTGWITVV
jgi:hypothetical protein